MAECSVDQCNRLVRSAQGWCYNHYRKWKRNGTPTPLKPSIEERFFSRVTAVAGGCWNWRNARSDGYGTSFSPVKGQPVYPHIWSYRFFVGEIPEGLVLDHLCRNRRCVNPSHLDPVTQQENVRRVTCLITHCPSGHEYTAENTYNDPRGARQCRTCIRRRSRAFELTKKEVTQRG